MLIGMARGRRELGMLDENGDPILDGVFYVGPNNSIWYFEYCPPLPGECFSLNCVRGGGSVDESKTKNIREIIDQVSDVARIGGTIHLRLGSIENDGREREPNYLAPIDDPKGFMEDLKEKGEVTKADWMKERLAREEG